MVALQYQHLLPNVDRCHNIKVYVVVDGIIPDIQYIAEIFEDGQYN